MLLLNQRKLLCFVYVVNSNLLTAVLPTLVIVSSHTKKDFISPQWLLLSYINSQGNILFTSVGKSEKENHCDFGNCASILGYIVIQ